MKTTLKGAGLAVLIGVGVGEVDARDRKTNGGYIACLTESLLDQATEAKVAGATDIVRELLNGGGCLVPMEGLRLRVLDFGMMVSKIRVYPHGSNEGLTLYAPTEIIRR